MPSDPFAVIIGSNRGIGLGVVKEMLGRGWSVISTARQPGRAAELSRLAATHPGRVQLEQLEMTNTTEIDQFAARLGGRRLEAVLVNAGIAGPGHQSASAATMEEVGLLMFTNAVAPIRLARHLIPLINRGGVLAFTSSGLGSIAGSTGGHELYRASKAALNMLARGLAAETAARSIALLSLHPGWVRTDMGGPSAPVRVEDSARGLVNVIERARGRTGHRYLDYQGAEITW